MTTITLTPRATRWWRWPLLLVSFPLSSLAASLLLGPVTSVTVALLAGALVGLALGITSALALGTPWRRWVPLTVIGLALGTLAVVVVPAVAPIVQGLVLALAQAAARPPLRALIWVPLATAAWAIAWLISWVVAISDEPGFVTFGASGALFFTLVMFVVKRVTR